MKKIPILLLLVSILTSCVATVLGSTATSLIVYDRRSLSTIERDARIYYLINKKLVRDPKFVGSRIVITSFNRQVLLTGQTPIALLKEVAEKVAQKTPYVIRVYDEIEVTRPISMVKQTKDTWITSQVRSKMIMKKGLESGSIRVVTENQTVYLMGIVTPAQANSAVDVARRVKGVTKVVKIFRYIR